MVYIIQDTERGFRLGMQRTDLLEESARVHWIEQHGSHSDTAELYAQVEQLWTKLRTTGGE